MRKNSKKKKWGSLIAFKGEEAIQKKIITSRGMEKEKKALWRCAVYD